MSDRFAEYRKKPNPREQSLELKRLRNNEDVDFLTGLPNRRRLVADLKQLYAGLNRGESYFAGLYMDVDNFKAVNDTIGHGEGDVLLKRVATILEHSIRETDSVYRIGGDEMFVLFRNINPDSVFDVSAKFILSVRTVFAHQIRTDTREAYSRIGLSFGVAKPLDNDKPDDLLARADQAMYIDKAGKSDR